MKYNFAVSQKKQYTILEFDNFPQNLESEDEILEPFF